jgi:predicted aldo/keto reductase-like oxidoreductase
MERTHGAEWTREWSRDLPPYVDIPGEINVQEIVRLWNYAKGLDLVEWGKMRYNLMGNAGHWFPGTNAAEFDERGVLRALDGYRFAERIPPILREAHALLHAAPKKRLSEGG